MKQDFILVRDEGNENWAYKLCDKVVKKSEDEFTARPLIWIYDVPERSKSMDPNYEPDPKMQRFGLVGWFMSSPRATEIGGPEVEFKYKNSAPEFLNDAVKIYKDLVKRFKAQGCKRVPRYTINGQII